VKAELIKADLCKAATIMADSQKHGTGADVTTFFQLESKEKTNNKGAKGIEHTAVPDFVLLAHELIHGDRIIRGAFDNTHGPQKVYQEQWRHHSKPGSDVKEISMSVEEIYTVGCYPVDGQAVTVTDTDIGENDIRGEHGLAPRVSYP
jgi:hypothetical protein